MGARSLTSNDSGAAVRGEGTSGAKVRSLDSGSRGPTTTGSGVTESRKDRNKRAPRINVKMTSLPDVKEQNAPKAGANEPRAQKPDIKLSPSDVAGDKQGMAASLDQIVREDREKKRASPAAKRPGTGLTGFAAAKEKAAADEEDRRAQGTFGNGASSRRSWRSVWQSSHLARWWRS